jgi:hypothetical protein
MVRRGRGELDRGEGREGGKGEGNREEKKMGEMRDLKRKTAPKMSKSEILIVSRMLMLL